MDVSNLPEGVRTSTHMMTQEQVRERVEQDRRDGKQSEFYEWESRRLETAVPANDVKTVIMDALAAFTKLAAETPVASDEDLREQLMASDARFRVMGDADQGTHPRWFEKVTTRGLPKEHLALMLSMIEMRHRQEAGHVKNDDASKEVTEFFHSKVKELTEAESKEASEARVRKIVEKDAE